MVVCYWFILHFSQKHSHKISNLKPNMTYNMIKIQILLHQALDYSQIYNFTLDHDYKFKIIIVLKDVWVSKFKIVYVFLFFEFFEDMDPFLWNILKFTKKLKWFGEHLMRKKDFWNKKTTCPHVFLKCFKHIKELLKHGEFSWKICSYNFESIRIYFKIKWMFWYIMIPWWFFKVLKIHF
jgi:hypothetical protein